jgi:hypothetical protein
VGGVAKDGDNTGSVAVDVDERIAVDLVVAVPSNREIGIGFLEVDLLGISVARETGSKVIGGVEHPRRGCGNVIDLVGETKILPVEGSLARSA